MVGCRGVWSGSKLKGVSMPSPHSLAADIFYCAITSAKKWHSLVMLSNQDEYSNELNAKLIVSDG